MSSQDLSADVLGTASASGRHHRRPRSRPRTKAELSAMSKEDLVDRVVQLEAYNEQLRRLLASKVAEQEGGVGGGVSGSGRDFDWNSCSWRRVALCVLYAGWHLHGLASQEHTTLTVEHQLFAALGTARLVRGRQGCGYQRCGRTDAGVSAARQVVTLTVRSRLRQEDADAGVVDGELAYARLLNRLLPPHVRVLAWRPVGDAFSARFQCERRTYRYHFPRGGLDADAMATAARLLVGTHDFSNYCKRDASKEAASSTPPSYVRTIASIDVQVGGQKKKKKIDDTGGGDGDDARLSVATDDFSNCSQSDASNGAGAVSKPPSIVRRIPSMDVQVGGQKKKKKIDDNAVGGDEARLLVGTRDLNCKRDGTNDAGAASTPPFNVRSMSGMDVHFREQNKKIDDDVGGFGGDDARLLIGCRDLSSYCECDTSMVAEASSGSASIPPFPVRTIPSVVQVEGGAEKKKSDDEDDAGGGDATPYDMCTLTVTGNAFLWHQVRCIMGVLLLVGEGKERPDVAAELLNVDAHPRRPQYCLASELPLELYSCRYPPHWGRHDAATDAANAEGGEWRGWVVDADDRRHTAAVLQTLWARHAVRAHMLRGMLERMPDAASVAAQADWLLQGVRPRLYRPLLQRPTCQGPARPPPGPAPQSVVHTSP